MKTKKRNPSELYPSDLFIIIDGGGVPVEGLYETSNEAYDAIEMDDLNEHIGPCAVWQFRAIKRARRTRKVER